MSKFCGTSSHDEQKRLFNYAEQKRRPAITGPCLGLHNLRNIGLLFFIMKNGTRVSNTEQDIHEERKFGPCDMFDAVHGPRPLHELKDTLGIENLREVGYVTWEFAVPGGDIDSWTRTDLEKARYG